MDFCINQLKLQLYVSLHLLNETGFLANSNFFILNFTKKSTGL